MIEDPLDSLQIHRCPELDQAATLVLAFSGWMDGGDVSTGTVKRLVHLLDAEPIAEIDPEPFYIYNFPGSMEIASLFRPHIEIEDGVITAQMAPTQLVDEGVSVSYGDTLRTRIDNLDAQLIKLDEAFRSGMIDGDTYVEQRVRLKHTRQSLEDELHRIGVTT